MRVLGLAVVVALVGGQWDANAQEAHGGLVRLQEVDSSSSWVAGLGLRAATPGGRLNRSTSVGMLTTGVTLAGLGAVHLGIGGGVTFSTPPAFMAPLGVTFMGVGQGVLLHRDLARGTSIGMKLGSLMWFLASGLTSFTGAMSVAVAGMLDGNAYGPEPFGHATRFAANGLLALAGAAVWDAQQRRPIAALLPSGTGFELVLLIP